MLKQKFTLSYGLQLFVQAFNIVGSIIVARIAGPEIIGIVAYCMALVGMFKVFGSLGINTAHVKLISEGSDPGKCNATFAVLKIFASLIFLLVFIAYYLVKVYILNIPFENNVYRIVILVFVVFNFFEMLNYIPRSTFIGNVERGKVEIPNALQSILAKSFRIVVVLLGYGAIALALSNLTALILIIPLNIYLFRNKPFARFDRGTAKQYFRLAIPAFLMVLSTSVIPNIDKVLLENLTNPQEVGYYTVILSIVAPVRLFGVSVSGLLFPTFSRLIAEGQKSEIRNLLTKYYRILLNFLLPFVLLVIIYSSTLVPLLFGEKFMRSVILLPFIACGLFMYILQLPHANLLLGSGEFKKASLIQFFNLALVILFILLMTSERLLNMGALGPSITLILTNSILFIIYFYVNKKTIPELTFNRSSLVILVQIPVSIFFYFGYLWIVDHDIQFFLYIYPLVYLSCIFLIMWKLKTFNKNDMKLLSGFVNLKSTYRYMKDDLKG